MRAANKGSPRLTARLQLVGKGATGFDADKWGADEAYADWVKRPASRKPELSALLGGRFSVSVISGQLPAAAVVSRYHDLSSYC